MTHYTDAVNAMLAGKNQCREVWSTSTHIVRAAKWCLLIREHVLGKYLPLSMLQHMDRANKNRREVKAVPSYNKNIHVKPSTLYFMKRRDEDDDSFLLLIKMLQAGAHRYDLCLQKKIYEKGMPCKFSWDITALNLGPEP